MEDTPATDSDDDEPFDFMAEDLDNYRVDPGDENISGETKPCMTGVVPRNEATEDRDEHNDPGISLRRSPEHPCLLRKADPDRMTPPPISLVQRIRKKMKPEDEIDPGSVPLAIPGLYRPPGPEIAAGNTERANEGPLSARERFRNISRQIKQGRLRKQAERREKLPMIYLLIPNGREKFLKKSSLSGLTKKRHFEDDISDDDISAFDKRSRPAAGASAQTPRKRSRPARIFGGVVGCIRAVLRGFTDCVWRCFGGDPEPEEPAQFRKMQGPRLEFNSLLDGEDMEENQPPEKTRGVPQIDIDHIRQTTV